METLQRHGRISNATRRRKSGFHQTLRMELLDCMQQRHYTTFDLFWGDAVGYSVLRTKNGISF